MSVHVIPLLLAILTGVLAGLIVWEFWLACSPWVEKASLKLFDYALVGLLLLAIFASGVLMTYTLLIHTF